MTVECMFRVVATYMAQSLHVNWRFETLVMPADFDVLEHVIHSHVAQFAELL